MSTDLAPRLTCLPSYAPVRTHSPEDGRQYYTPEGMVPSVTNILENSRDNSGLELWAEDIGIERATFIRRFSAHRGILTHTAIENYLACGEPPTFNFITDPYWRSIAPFVAGLAAPPLLMEGTLWHPLGYAGACDYIGYLKPTPPPTFLERFGPALIKNFGSLDCLNHPFLIDWKTADKPPKRTKSYEYSLQDAAYVAAANHVYASYGLNITQGAVVTAVRAQSCHIEWLNADALSQLFKHFEARLRRFTYARTASYKKAGAARTRT